MAIERIYTADKLKIQCQRNVSISQQNKYFNINMCAKKNKILWLLENVTLVS